MEGVECVCMERGSVNGRGGVCMDEERMCAYGRVRCAHMGKGGCVHILLPFYGLFYSIVHPSHIRERF